MATGTVSSWVNSTGSVFYITPDGQPITLYSNASEISAKGFTSLPMGQRVSFEQRQSYKGPSFAVNIKPI